MTKIFQPIKFKDITIKNRIGMSPMCQYSSTDGFATDWHFVHYTTRAIGGAGLIIVEATAIVPEGRITACDLGIWKDEHIVGLRRITESILHHGAIPAIQLAHAGRKASHNTPSNGSKQLSKSEGGWMTFAPSSIAFEENEIAPESLDLKAINHLVCRFKEAAMRAYDAGFKIIEIHAAHGYLLHQFLSPLTNKRTDAYGGSFENRTRILLEVVIAVKEVWPSNYPIFVRLSTTDWAENGWNLEETVKLCESLQQMGIDLIDCSSGGNIPNVKIPLADGYQIPFSEAIRNSGIPTATVGLIYEVGQITSILANDKADMVLLGRVLLRNPYFPLQIATLLNEDTKWPIQYLRGK